MASESASARRIDRGGHRGRLRRFRAGDRRPDHARGVSAASTVLGQAVVVEKIDLTGADLHSRLSPRSRAIEEYRRLVADAIYPDPFSKRRVSVRDAAAAIVEYRRSTGDATGTVDLMLTFIEAGTEQAADLGYGDEAYFDALQIRLDAVAKAFDTLPAQERANVAVPPSPSRARAQPPLASRQSMWLY